MIYKDGELEMIQELILLPIVLTVLEHDKKAIEKTNLKFHRPYLDMMNMAMKRVTKDVNRIKRELGSRGIKIVSQEKREHGLYCVFLCRGHRDVFEMWSDFLKAETEIRMMKYLLMRE
jgi:hypothetical protein